MHWWTVCVAGVLLEPSEQLWEPREERCYYVQQLVRRHHLLSVQVDATEEVVVNILGTQGFPYLNNKVQLNNINHYQKLA